MLFHDVLTDSNSLPGDLMNGQNDKDIIDIVEKTLTSEELAKDYVDIKQASQILNNVSTKTAKKYIDDVSESHGFKMEVVTVTSNGGVKKLYKKEMIVTIARILNKDKTVLVHVPVGVSEGGFQDKETSNSSSNGSSNSFPSHSNSFQEVPTGEGSQKLAISESLRGISELRTNFKEFSTNLRELNDNVRQVNMTMQNTISKIVEQGIDLKERYLEDRIKRTEIEKQQAETLNLLLQRNADAEKLQTETLKALAEKSAQAEKLNAETLKLLSEKTQPIKTNSNTTLVILLSVLGLIVIGWGAFYFFTTNQQKMEYQFEDRLAQERQIQQDQFQQTLKQFKQSMTPAATNAAMPAGQGTK